MEKSLLLFIDCIKDLEPDLTAEMLFEKVKNNEKLLKRLCDCSMNAYEQMQNIKKNLF